LGHQGKCTTRNRSKADQINSRQEIFHKDQAFS
jgi:hypothetical protein